MRSKLRFKSLGAMVAVMCCTLVIAVAAIQGSMIDRLLVDDLRRSNYFQSDVFEKVEKGIRWLSDNGYEPCFWSEGLLGST